MRNPPLARRLATWCRWGSVGLGLAVVGLVGTGGWVRLSESGLGCPTWPKCTSSDLVAPGGYHSLVEFTNRCLIAAVGIGAAAVLVLAIIRRERREILLSASLLGIYLGEAVVGGITVLAKLAPWLVAIHLILALVLVVNAVALVWVAWHAPRLWEPPMSLVWLGRLTGVSLGLVAAAGTVATGSGPYAGSPGTKRFPLRFAGAVEFHAVLGVFLFGLVVATGFLLLQAGAPRRIWVAYAALVALVALQGALGYAQWFAGLPVGLVEAHIIGSALVVAAMARFNLELAPPRWLLSQPLRGGDLAYLEERDAQARNLEGALFFAKQAEPKI